MVDEEIEEDDVTESDVYEDPAVLYEDAIEDPDPIDLDNYLVRGSLIAPVLLVSIFYSVRFLSKSSFQKTSLKARLR